MVGKSQSSYARWTQVPQRSTCHCHWKPT